MLKRVICLISVFCLAILSSCSRNSDNDLMQFSVSDTSVSSVIDLNNSLNMGVRLYKDSVPELTDAIFLAMSTGIYRNSEIREIVRDYYIMLTAPHNELQSIPVSDLTPNTGMHPYYGAVCLPIDQDGRVNISKIMLITSDKEDLQSLTELLNYKKLTLSEYISIAYGTELSDEMLDNYMTYGGAPWLEGHCIVIGQIYSGYHNIAMLEQTDTDPETYIPTSTLNIKDFRID